MTHRTRNRVLGALSFACFCAGFFVGMAINANVGAGLWGLAVVLAFAPFASHRNKQV